MKSNIHVSFILESLFLVLSWKLLICPKKHRNVQISNMMVCFTLGFKSVTDEDETLVNAMTFQTLMHSEHEIVCSLISSL